MSARAPRSGKAAAGKVGNNVPSRDEILAYIAENPDMASRRHIAKAFGLRGEARVILKDILREMAAEGILEKRRKRLVRPGTLPHVSLLDIYGRDGDGDLLARPTEWSGAPDEEPPVVLIEPRKYPKGQVPGIGLRVLARTFPTGEAAGPAYTGQVLKVIERRRETALGILRKASDGSFRMEPVERRQAELWIAEGNAGGARPGDLIEVEPLRTSRSGPPAGRILAVVGSLATEKSLSMIALHQHEIPHVFPAGVLAEAETVKPAPATGREDWRALPLVTIDPADAKDHDDAVFASVDEDPSNPDGFVVVVAIADVGAYVRPGSAMDEEALKRGNSVYFPDRVVPMLPERIANDLCSLRDGEDRPALAVRMQFTGEGRKLRHSFHRVQMRSRARLSYVQAQAAIDGAPDNETRDILDPVLRPLWRAHAALRKARQAREPLELDLPERKILLKADGTVDRVVVPERLEAHRLIEEFMIQANVAAAEVLEAGRHPLIYRVHDSPSQAKQESLRQFLRTIGQSLARGADLTPARFNAILKRFEGTEYEQLVNEVVLRTQSQAEYSPYNIGHFGLNLRSYAHFTSPIRRYADLVVHRALIRLLKLGNDGLQMEDEARLEEISGLISVSERRAMAAERDTADRLIAAHLATRIGAEFSGRVAGVTSAGLFVQLHHIGADGFIPVSKLANDYYVYDEAGHALAGRRTGKGYRLGDPVEVRLAEVQPMAGAMRFDMVSEPRPLPQGLGSFHKERGRKKRRQQAR